MKLIDAEAVIRILTERSERNWKESFTEFYGEAAGYAQTQIDLAIADIEELPVFEIDDEELSCR